MKLGSTIPPENRIYRHEMKKTESFRTSENGPLVAKDMEGSLKIYKLPIRPIGSERMVDGTLKYTTELTEEAYQILKDAGYTDDQLVFDLGKKPAKYNNKSSLPAFEYKFDSAQNMLNSIFDRIYRSVESAPSRYKNIELHLEKPVDRSQPAPSKDNTPAKESYLKVGDKIDLTKLNHAPPVEEKAYDVALTSKANYNYMGKPAYVEGAYKSETFLNDYESHLKGHHVISNGNYKHDFLDLSNDDIIEYAYKFANGQDSDAYDLKRDLNKYAERALEYFGGYKNEYKDGVLLETGETIQAKVYLHHSQEQIKEAYHQIEQAIKDYGEQIKAGNGDIDSVETKITIGDMEFTLGELVKTQEFVSDVVKNADHNSYNAKYYASAGMAIAAVNNFAKNNLSADTARKLGAMFEKRIDVADVERNDPNRPEAVAMRAAMDRQAREIGNSTAVYSQPKWNRSVESMDYYNTQNSDMKAKTLNAETFAKFKNISNSSSFETGFEEAIEWMQKQFGAWYDFMGHTTKTKENNWERMNQSLQNMYNSFEG